MRGEGIGMKMLLLIALVLMAIVAPVASSVAYADYSNDKSIQAP